MIDEKELYQRLDLLRMALMSFRQRVNAEIDSFDMEIARLLPEEEGRGRHYPSLEEALTELKVACNIQHGPRSQKKHYKRKA